jgi:Domain of unknown function (DUF4864)
MPKELKILLSVVVCGLVVIGLFVGTVFWATSGLLEPIERQLTALKSGDIDAAYAETSVAFRHGTSKGDFAKFVDKFPVLRNAASHSLTNRSIEDDIGKVSGSLIASSGALTPIAFQLVKEEGAWKIVNINLGE